MFSNGSSSSISLLTVTPSFVTVGPPKDLLIITLRPRGPNVMATASANLSTPASNFGPARRLRTSIALPREMTPDNSLRGVLGLFGLAADAKCACGLTDNLREKCPTRGGSCTLRHRLRPRSRPYLPKITSSPIFYGKPRRGCRNRAAWPGPVAMTFAALRLLSWAASGSTMPPAVICSASSGSTTTRSSSGRNFDFGTFVNSCYLFAVFVLI